MRVLLSSFGKELHEFIEMDDPPPVIRLPILAKDFTKGANKYESATLTPEELKELIDTHKYIVFISLGVFDGVHIYIEEEEKARQG